MKRQFLILALLGLNLISFMAGMWVVGWQWRNAELRAPRQVIYEYRMPSISQPINECRAICARREQQRKGM